VSDQCGADTKVCVNVSLKVNYRFQYKWSVNCNIRITMLAPTDIAIVNWNHLYQEKVFVELMDGLQH